MTIILAILKVLLWTLAAIAISYAWRFFVLYRLVANNAAVILSLCTDNNMTLDEYIQKMIENTLKLYEGLAYVRIMKKVIYQKKRGRK